MTWTRVRLGLTASLFITCPNCGDEAVDPIEFDADELAGAVEISADCPECEHVMTAYLEAIVQEKL